MPENLDIDRILANPNARVIIALPRASVSIAEARPGKIKSSSNAVVGYVTSQLSFGGAADYNNPLDSGKQQALDQTLTKLQTGFGKASELLGFEKGFIPNISLKTVANSLSVWSSSSKPVFNIQMLIIATKPTDNVLNDVKKLLATVYPTFSGDGLKAVINPPLGYTAAAAGASRGQANTLTIQVGKWFRAPFQIMKSVEHTFSQEVIENGSPLYATVSFSFEPTTAISAQEAQEYISLV